MSFKKKEVFLNSFVLSSFNYCFLVYSVSPSLPNLQPTPHQINATSLQQVFSYGDIQKYTEISFQNASTKQFMRVKKWRRANFFLTINRNMFAWKFVKSESFWHCCGSILSSMSCELKFVKWVRFFEWNCIVKCMIVA